MNKNIKAIIEGLLFIYGDEGISLLDFQNVLEDKRPADIQEIILELQKLYSENDDCAFSIQKFGKNKYRLQTKPELHEYFAKLEIVKNNTRLSPSCIEVLSVITYKGPITKNQIDEMRDADSSYQFYKLRDRKLIKAVGKTETGANLYTITDNFFKLFNIQGGFEALPQIEFAKVMPSIIEETQNVFSGENKNSEDQIDENQKFDDEFEIESDEF